MPKSQPMLGEHRPLILSINRRERLVSRSSAPYWMGADWWGLCFCPKIFCFHRPNFAGVYFCADLPPPRCISSWRFQFVRKHRRRPYCAAQAEQSTSTLLRYHPYSVVLHEHFHRLMSGFTYSIAVIRSRLTSSGRWTAGFLFLAYTLASLKWSDAVAKGVLFSRPLRKVGFMMGYCTDTPARAYSPAQRALTCSPIRHRVAQIGGGAAQGSGP